MSNHVSNKVKEGKLGRHARWPMGERVSPVFVTGLCLDTRPYVSAGWTFGWHTQELSALYKD